MGNIAVLEDEFQHMLLTGDTTRRRKKQTLQRSKSTPDLRYLSVFSYITGRLHDRGWKLGEADPAVSCQRKLSPVSPQHKSSEGTSAKDVPKVDHLLKYTNSVAALTLNVMLDVPLLELKGVLTKQSYQVLRDSTFRCIANAILNIFDEEDFERIQNFKELCREYEKFAPCVDQSKDVAELTLKFDNISILREYDVFCILEGYEKQKARGWYQAVPWDYDVRIQFDNIYKSDLNLAKGVIQNFVPLKRSDRIQLALELLFQKCYNVYDTLAIGILAGIMIHGSFTEESMTSSDHKLPEYELDVAGTLAWFIVGVVRALSLLVEIKSSALDFFQRALIYPITSSGCFGPCHEDVIEVISFADFGRRLEGVRFISTRHLLFSLSLSGVGRWVKRLLNVEGQVHKVCGTSEMSLLSILEKSRKIAGSSGREPVSDEAIEVTLDDVVLAIFPQQHALEGEVKETISAIDDGEWDADILNSLGLTDCYTLEDVQIWKSFSNSPDDAVGHVSRFFVPDQMMMKKYTLYIPNMFKDDV